MTHTVEATAWTLIHFCWQAAVIAGIYRMLSAAFARSASHMRYLVALSALLAMLGTAVFTFAWEMRSEASAPAATRLTTGTVGTSDFPRVVAPGILSRTESGKTESQIPNLLPSLMGWIDAFWALGVFALSMRGLGGWWLIHRLRTSATIQAPEAARAAFERLSRALGLRRTVLLRVSSAIAGPVTVGALRAMVLLPISAATSLSPEELEVVLAHELAHIRRADFAWNLVQTLIETLFFFHPAVWWISGCVRHERELCCDDLALKVCPNPVVYASALFHLEEQRSRQMHLAMALDGHQSRQTLRMRIARILGETMPSTPSFRPFSAAAVLAAIIVMLVPVPQVVAGLRPASSSAASLRVAKGLNAAAIPNVSVNAALSKPHPAPEPASRATVADPQQVAQAQTQSEAPAPRASEEGGPKTTYIDRMKAAGYDVDLDKLIAMKVQNVTPEYARAMSQLGFGKLSADDLIACKVQDVSPEIVAEFKKQGFEVKSIHDAISYRIFQVTPEFAEGMKAAGFKDLDSKKLLSLRVQGVTPEYARSIAQQYSGATVDDVIKTRIFNIDAEFINSAKKHGFTNLSLDKLVQLRISGVLDDETVKP